MTHAKPDAWMPLYIGDWDGDTRHLDCEQDGAYGRLVRHYWRNGPLPDDDGALARIVGMERARWRKVRPVIAAFFIIADGIWRHKRADQELAKATAKRARAIENGKAKWGEVDSTAERGRSQRSKRLSEARQKGKHTALEWELLKHFCGPLCLRCGKAGELVKDHIKPVYQGGSDAIDNLQPLCRKCNASKGPESKDHRPDGWRDAIRTPAGMPAKTPAKRQPRACSSPSSVQVEGPLHSPSTLNSRANGDLRCEDASPPRSEVVVDFPAEARDRSAERAEIHEGLTEMLGKFPSRRCR